MDNIQIGFYSSLQSYSLVMFHQDDYYVIKSEAIKKRDGNKCIVKYNGAFYDAEIVPSCIK